MELVTMHTHTNYTGHGHGTVAELFPAPDLLRTFCRAGIPCSIGTDAHDPAVVDRNLMPGLAAMYEAGYRCVTVPTSTGDRRQIALE